MIEQTSDESIKTCPCCGAMAVLEHTDKWVWVKCTGCGLSSYSHGNNNDCKAGTIAAWNRRDG